MLREKHNTNKSGWLRAAVLGANDGILSTTSLVIGVAAASVTRSPIILAALAGLVAGALSMAAGEYVSVSSQSDVETADLKREQIELDTMPEEELKELAGFYKKRGLDNELAMKVAIQLSKKNVLEAHARDELGINEISEPKPLQAAFASGTSFISGGLLPLLVSIFAPIKFMVDLSIFIFNSIPGIFGYDCSQSGRVRHCKKCIKDLFLGNHRHGYYCRCGVSVRSKDYVNSRSRPLPAETY